MIAARPVLAIIYVTAGAVLIVTKMTRLVLWLASLASAQTDLGTDICFRIVIPAAIVLLALIGAWLFAVRFTRGNERGGLIAAALFLGIFAVGAQLALAAIGGGTAMHRTPAFSINLYILGSILVLLQVAGEELLLRGLLQPILCRAWGVPAGLVVSAVIFAIVHLSGGWSDPVTLSNIFLAGLWFGLLAWRTGGLLAPILAHWGYNWSEEMLFGASPNPGTGTFGSLLDVDLTGTSIWGGAADGLNASILLSFVLILLIVPLILDIPPRRNIAKKAAALS